MEEEKKRNANRPTAAFVVSLIAGLWMLFAAGMGGMEHMRGHGWGGRMMDGWGHGGGYGWMWRHHQMMHGYGGGTLWGWTGIVAGALVLLGAIFLYARPSTARGWGVVILVASAFAILSGAGGFLAGVLGLIGGALAVTWKPEAS